MCVLNGSNGKGHPMLTFGRTMDPQSVDILYKGAKIGAIQWHNELVISWQVDMFTNIPVDILEQITKKARELTTR